ncbi:MAG: hypothetical protein GY750_20850 [Lentisphaerae bacterium]|nr:hypothetical protein [Lentisphaerota bacterium]
MFDNADYFKAWVTILMEVNHEKKGFVFNGTPVICDRGQSAYSLNNWSKMFGKGWTVQKVRTFFKHLANDGMIIVEEVKRITTKLSVCNYDTYQNQQQTDNKLITNRQQTDNKPLTTTKELKNERMKEDIPQGKPVVEDKFSEWDFKVAERYHEKICNIHSSIPSLKKADLKKWADTIRLLREQDGHDKDIIGQCLKFALQDEFWSKQAQSLKAIRGKGQNGLSKFENILTKMNNQTTDNLNVVDPLDPRNFS